MKKIKILIADDHPIVRAGFKQVISDMPDMLVADEAGNGQEALAYIRKKDYDLVLLDISMPGRSGLEVLKDLKSEKPKLPVLILSIYPEEQYAIRALRAGASGYMTKDSAPNELIAAIRKISEGGKYISASLAEKLTYYLDGDASRPPQEVPGHANDRLRQDGDADRRRTLSERQDNQHLPHAHSGKDENEKQCRDYSLRGSEQACGVIGRP
jgi:DNA-binding NarL/FixJ family response regulator